MLKRLTVNMSYLSSNMGLQLKNLNLQFLLLISVLSALFFLFFSRYTFAFNSADSDCLNASFFLVDKRDKDVSKGHLAAFTMKNENTLHGAGGRWIKRVAATEGMQVDVELEQTTINKTEIIKNDMSHTLSYLGLSITDMTPSHTIKKGELFMMGETITSYDSRYWGSISTNDIIGKAYAIF